ncbi:MAG TPA: hypothetical protein DCQ64_22060 [Candidatus Rokubacteria bacterium]|nr:hypothetical protein [Candidatus Rokubacteria bacterium]
MKAPQLLLASLFFWGTAASAAVVRRELIIEKGEVNLSGRKTVGFALTVNGSIPAPTLEFTEGDELEISVVNRMPDEEASIHWHGILLPSEMDGVPYVTTPPILPGGSFTFRFRLRQSGTYWYHSHTDVQEQKGVYGAFIIRPKKQLLEYDRDLIVVLSDWSDEDSRSILKNLRKDGEYYLHKKGTMRSWWGALRAGALKTYLNYDWTRMGGMDASDVGYDAFLINGKRSLQLAEAHPGETLRLRIVNAAASSYFKVTMGGGPMRVVSADGVDVKPASADEILMGMAETYDVLFTVPEHRNYELRASAQDGTGGASGWIGMGPEAAAPRSPAPDPYAPMDPGTHAGHVMTAAAAPMDHGDPHAHAGHSASAPQAPPSSPAIASLTVDDLRAPAPTAFSAEAPRHDVRLVLDGDMTRYVWHINGKAIHQDRTLMIREGDIVRYTFVNKTMMHHPMHLHGHFFRALNEGGDHSPLKHTVDVPPHSERTIELRADEPGEWMLHCHNLYHFKTGMARVVKYSSFTPSPHTLRMQKHDPHLHDHLYYYGRLDAASNASELRLRASQTWNEYEARYETMRRGSDWDHEGEALYRRRFGRFLALGGGLLVDDGEASAGATVGYILPMFVETRAFVDHRGGLRLDVEKRLQWSRRVFSDLEVNFRKERPTDFKATLMYQPNWAWALGFVGTHDGPGAGLRYQF